MDTMKKAQDAIQELQDKCGVEQFEELLEIHETQKMTHEQIQQLMSQFGLDDEDVNNDLEQLEVEIANEEMAEVPNSKIKTDPKKNQKQLITN